MARKPDLLHNARIAGMQLGDSVAGWYFDSTTPGREDFLKVLKGIEDVDPEILDTFNDRPLSGEYAGDMTPQQLYADLEMTDRQIELYGDEICTQYEDGYHEAYENAIVNTCREQLRRVMIFHIEVETIDQDEQKLLAKLDELLIKAGCSYLHSHVAEEGELVDA